MAEAEIGPLRNATMQDTLLIADPVTRARAQHVVSENERVREFAQLLAAGDLAAAGGLMVASHNSLRDLYLTSTPVMDAAVEQLMQQKGVYGARRVHAELTLGLGIQVKDIRSKRRHSSAAVTRCHVWMVGHAASLRAMS
jgi:hypothetical protein